MTTGHDRAEPARMAGGPSTGQVAERARRIGLRISAADRQAAAERLRAIGRALAEVPAFDEVPVFDEAPPFDEVPAFDEADRRPDLPFDPRWS